MVFIRKSLLAGALLLFVSSISSLSLTKAHAKNLLNDGGICSFDNADLTPCGYAGISADKCQAWGCCWASSERNGRPGCFYKNAVYFTDVESMVATFMFDKGTNEGVSAGASSSASTGGGGDKKKKKRGKKGKGKKKRSGEEGEGEEGEDETASPKAEARTVVHVSTKTSTTTHAGTSAGSFGGFECMTIRKTPCADEELTEAECKKRDCCWRDESDPFSTPGDPLCFKKRDFFPALF